MVFSLVNDQDWYLKKSKISPTLLGINRIVNIELVTLDKPQDNGNISLLSYEDLIEYIGQAGKSVYPCYLVLG